MPTLPVGKATIATNRGRYSTNTFVGANRGTVLLLLVSTGEDILQIPLYCRYQQGQIFYLYYSYVPTGAFFYYYCRYNRGKYSTNTTLL
jgi:hypothetical protein